MTTSVMFAIATRIRIVEVVVGLWKVRRKIGPPDSWVGGEGILFGDISASAKEREVCDKLCLRLMVQREACFCSRSGMVSRPILQHCK